MNPSNEVRAKAPLILAEISKAKSVLLHCHPSPDPDSVGSALAMKFALEQLGKKATVIKGDSDIPAAFMHFPGAKDIVMKNYFEIDLNEFDLFIVLDSSQKGVSKIKLAEFPTHMTVINIDHHISNPGCGKVNLIDASYPAVGQLLYDLFGEWKVKITSEIAANLFIGMYTDTGGFKYRGVTKDTYAAAANLVSIYPDFPDLIAKMQYTESPHTLKFYSLAYASIETFFGNVLAIASVSNAELQSSSVPTVDASASDISSSMNFVADWSIVCAIIENEPGQVRISFRLKKADIYDVSKITVALGGGGHKAAAGATLNMTIEAAKQKVVQTVKDMYNL